MSDLGDFQSELAQFSGQARLFPLPNLVLFPHAVQPLHVFEPRYRDLMAEAIASDQTIVMACLAPGWEAHYVARPEVYPMACLGKITTYQRLPDGRYNLLLKGISRVRLGEELF